MRCWEAFLGIPGLFTPRHRDYQVRLWKGLSASSPCPGNPEELMVGGDHTSPSQFRGSNSTTGVTAYLGGDFLGFSFMSYLVTDTSSMYG